MLGWCKRSRRFWPTGQVWDGCCFKYPSSRGTNQPGQLNDLHVLFGCFVEPDTFSCFPHGKHPKNCHRNRSAKNQLKKIGWGVTGHPLALIHVDPCWEDRPWPWLLPHQLHQAARWDPWDPCSGDTGDGISPSGAGPAVGRGGSRLGRWLEQRHGLISAISDPCNKVIRLW